MTIYSVQELRFWCRRDTAANWTSVNPILSSGEWGVETDNTGSTPRKYKMGDGVTAWVSLPYSNPGAFVVDSIADSDTTHAPSRNAVFDALVLKRDTALANGYLWVGNGSGQSAAVLMSGDVTITNAGVASLATAQSATHTWAATQTFTLAPVFTDASGTRTALGLAIGTNVQAWDTQLDSLASLIYGSNALKVVRVNAGETGFELATVSAGSGDVVGPASATADAVVLFNGTTGKLIKDSTKAYTPTGIGLGSVTNDAQTKSAIVPNTAPSAGQLLVGNAGGTAYAPVSASGDVTVASTGAVTIGNGVVTLAKIANAAANSKLLGSGASGSGAAYSEITIGSGLSMSGTTLSSSGSSAPIASGTSNPGSPSTNDLFYRTDLGLIIYYDGTRWLSISEYTLSGSPYRLDSFTTTAIAPIRFPVPSDYNIYLTRLIIGMQTETTSSGTQYWTWDFRQLDSAGTQIGGALASGSTISTAANTMLRYDVNINAALSSSARFLYPVFTKVSTPGALDTAYSVLYRKIIT